MLRIYLTTSIDQKDNKDDCMLNHKNTESQNGSGWKGPL